jgi:hypothetical protein
MEAKPVEILFAKPESNLAVHTISKFHVIETSISIQILKTLPQKATMKM